LSNREDSVNQVHEGGKLANSSSPLKVSNLAIGCNSFGRSVDGREVKSIVSAALANGVNLFDTADVYGDPHGSAEQLLGQALGKERSRAIIATKFGFPMDRGRAFELPSGHGSRRYVLSAVEASLRRLRTDYIDIVQLHIPDPATPVAETLSALNTLVERGKIRWAGLSRHSAAQIREAAAASSILASVQAEYSLLCFEAETTVLSATRSLGLAFLACLPLASGLLTGKYLRTETPIPGSRLADPVFAHWFRMAPWDKIEAIRDFADKRSTSLLQLSLGYLLAQPAVTSVIVGVTSAAQVLANVEASAWRPDIHDVGELRALIRRWPNFNARVPWELAGKW
jgi:aryl-alcohol dehydrogenase-like predicted oxidoreductase